LRCGGGRGRVGGRGCGGGRGRGDGASDCITEQKYAGYNCVVINHSSI